MKKGRASPEKLGRGPALGGRSPAPSPESVSKVVFLDIDGVLQPDNARIRVTEEKKRLKDFYKSLYKSFQVDYSVYSQMDVMTVYHLWDKESVANLLHILNSSGAYIVLSSSWRIFPMGKMRDLFKIHGLDKYYVDNTMREDFRLIEQLRADEEGYKSFYVDRVIEILEYLKNHPNIENYVAIDDMNLIPGLENHFIRASQSLTRTQAEEAVEILNRENDPIPSE
ncbi:MAG: hypothetical protein LBR53_11040 [Deltaproteobacteria bacterium]|jgi:hypothetical protein|nr:hypothetical protein [Deltaproteobacteria bacterium]